MTQEEKLSKAVKLADAMYYAAQQLTTDASHLSKAMKDWWNFKNVELKEPEDEKIRQKFIKLVKMSSEVGGFALHKWEADEMLAWLEKQEGCEYIKKDWLEHIKQSWYKEGFIDGKYTPKELTINDATTLNELIDFLENGTSKLQHDLTLYANWLKTQFSPNEKQGEQKPTLRERYKNIAESEWFKKTHEGMSISDEEVSNVNKVEPKFKVGDWISNSACTIQITSIDDKYYWHDNNHVGGDIESIDKQYHLWTIQDAKDGDVLASELCDSIILFKGIKDDIIDFYCDYDFSKIDIPGDRFAVNNGQHYGNVEDSKDFHPATKEQRDTLFAKMKEAGYEWDAGKKELKKIEQKSAEWSENDEYRIGLLEALCKDKLSESVPNSTMYEEMRTTIDWLKSIKPQNRWKPSDEQITVLELASKYERVFTPKQIDILIGLKDQLKKLRGE